MLQKYFVKLTSEERSYLEKLVSSGEAPARKLRRAWILLKSDCSEAGPNWTYEAICDALDVNPVTVTNIRKAFSEGGVAQALGLPLPELSEEANMNTVWMAMRKPIWWQWLAEQRRKDMTVGRCACCKSGL